MRARFFSVLAALCALHFLSVATAQAVQLTETRDTFLSNDGRFVTPAPQYPFLVNGDTHQWTARVAFNEQGEATGAVLIRSTGSLQLDNTITKWIRTHWKSLRGKPTTLVTTAK